MRGGFLKHTDMNVFLRLAVVVFVLASIVIATKTLMKYNEYQEKIDEVERQKLECSDQIEELEYLLELEFDDEYVKMVAKEKLNLCMPDEVVYYNGLD